MRNKSVKVKVNCQAAEALKAHTQQTERKRRNENLSSLAAKRKKNLAVMND